MLRERNEVVERAAKIVGGVDKLAAAADVKVQVVYQWLSGERPVPAERAPRIEQATVAAGERVAVEELCPKVPWALVRANETPIDDGDHEAAA